MKKFFTRLLTPVYIDAKHTQMNLGESGKYKLFTVYIFGLSVFTFDADK